MPMGLRSAAYMCQRVTNAIMYIHRSFGFWSMNYLDNFGSAEKAQVAWDSFNLMTRILESIGAEEAQQKAIPPTTRLDFLGNTVDSQKMTLEVAAERKTELMQLMEEWMKKQKYSLKELQSLIGKLSFVTNCIRPGRIFINRLLEILRTTPPTGKVSMNEQILHDLRWWKNYLPGFDGVSILWLQDCLEVNAWLASDASLIGGGAMHEKQFFHLKFNDRMLQCTDNIAQRELFMIVIAIKLWGESLAGKVVRFSTDNQIAMYAINSGRTRDKFTQKCIREIAWVCAKFQILLKASYLKSELNVIPNTLSRWYQSTEARRTFKRLTEVGNVGQ